MPLIDATRPMLVGLAVEPLTQRLTPASRRALERGRGLARLVGTRLELVHAVPGDVFMRQVGDGDTSLAYHLSEEGRLALLEARRGTLDAGVPADLIFRPERPFDALVGRARALRPSLMLVGARERSQEGLGSLTQRLLEEAPCPVWAVGLGEPYQLHHVLVDVDANDEGALAAATQLRHLLGVDLHHRRSSVDGVHPDLIVTTSGASHSAAFTSSQLVISPGGCSAAVEVG
jgi:nucleotide-binding universal stress UspA family protein